MVWSGCIRGKWWCYDFDMFTAILQWGLIMTPPFASAFGHVPMWYSRPASLQLDSDRLIVLRDKAESTRGFLVVVRSGRRGR